MEKTPDLVTELRELNRLLSVMNRRMSPGRSFLNGILGSLGSVFGTGVVLAIFVYILSRLNIFGHFGEWLTQVISNAIPSVNPTDYFFK